MNTAVFGFFLHQVLIIGQFSGEKDDPYSLKLFMFYNDTMIFFYCKCGYANLRKLFNVYAGNQRTTQHYMLKKIYNSLRHGVASLMWRTFIIAIN